MAKLSMYRARAINRAWKKGGMNGARKLTHLPPTSAGKPAANDRSQTSRKPFGRVSGQ